MYCTLRWPAFSGGQPPPQLKPKPMYVVFYVEFDGIVRNIHFRQDITMKFFKNDGTMFCPNSLQRRGRNNFAHITDHVCAAAAAATYSALDATALQRGSHAAVPVRQKTTFLRLPSKHTKPKDCRGW